MAGAIATVTSAAAKEKELVKLYESMTPATRAIVDARKNRGQKRDVGMVLMAYDDGLMIRDMMNPDKEATYGTGAVAQLAAYFDESVPYLYSLMEFVKTFDRDFVQSMTSEPMPHSKHLTLSHWFSVMQLDKASDREKTLKRVIREGLTANQLELEIRSGQMRRKNTRSGGRPHSKPASPMAGLQKLGSLALGLQNYGKMCAEAVFSNIDELAPSDVSDTLLEKLKATKEQVDKTETELEEVKEHLSKNIERIESVLEEKAKADAEAKAAKDAEDAEEAAKATSAKMKTTSGKPAVVGTNGKPAGSGKKKKKKAKVKVKPVAAT